MSNLGNVLKNTGHDFVVSDIINLIESLLKHHFDKVAKEKPLKAKEGRCFPCESYYTPSGFPSHFNEADINSIAITGTFVCCAGGNCPCELTPYTIYRRLAIIDNLYNTNVCGKRKFGLMELAEAIWKLCDNGAGIHTDATLCALAENYVNQCINGTLKTNDPIKGLFDGVYGYTNKGNVQDHALSLISKYLFFLLKVNSTKGIGFPIYDKIVKDRISHIAKKLGCKNQFSTYASSNGYIEKKKILDNMPVYIFALSEIINALGRLYINLCKKYGMQEFELLDFFLWRIGKIIKGDYAPLLSKQEYLAYIKNQTLPQWVIDIKNKIKKLIP